MGGVLQDRVWGKWLRTQRIEGKEKLHWFARQKLGARVRIGFGRSPGVFG